MIDKTSFVEYIRDTPRVFAFHRYKISKPKSITYTDEVIVHPDSPQPPISLGALEWADMEAAVIGDIVKYCIAHNLIPYFSYFKLFLYRGGRCVGTRAFLEGGGQLEDAMSTVCELILEHVNKILSYADNELEDLIKRGESIRASSFMCFPEEKIDSAKDWKTVSQLVEHFQVSERTIYRWIAAGRIPSTKWEDHDAVYSLSAIEKHLRYRDIESGR